MGYPKYLTMIREKESLARDDRDITAFKKYRDQLTSALKKAKSNYHKRLSHHTHKKRPAVVWQSINEVVQRSNQKKSIDTLSISGEGVSGIQRSVF